MRTLDTDTNSARQLASYGGVLVCLRVELASGDIYLTSEWEPSDVGTGSLYTTVTDWGDISSRLGESQQFPQSVGGIVVADPDGALRELWEGESFQRVPCTVYWAVWTPGEAQPGIAGATSILRGAIAPAESWQEFDLAIQFGITDYAIRRQNVIELRATKDDYPYIDVEDDGRVVPIVYGRPRGFRGIYTNGGPVARVTEWISEIDTTIYVDDAAMFPQATPITIAIGREHITGSFAGNVFTVTARGYVLVTSTTTHDGPHKATARDTALIDDGENRYVGYMFRPSVQLDDGSVSRVTQFSTIIALSTPMSDILDARSREIVRFDETTGEMEFDYPFQIETEIGYLSGGIVADSPIQTGGWECTIKSGVPYTIQTIAVEHEEGSEIRLVDEPAEYIVARQDVAVRNVYVYGKRKPPWRAYAFATNAISGSITDLVREIVEGNSIVDTEDAWVPLPEEMYAVDTDTHAGTGDPITVVSLPRRPRELPGYVLSRDAILVDFAATVTNPAAVMEHIVETYGGMTVDFSTAQTKLAKWHMDFWTDDTPTVLDLFADLAYQSRCAIRWIGEEPDLIYQAANGGTPVVSLDRPHILTDMEHNSTFGMHREDIDSVYSEVTVHWSEQGELVGERKEQSRALKDATVEAQIGRRVLDIDCWAYADDTGPKALAYYMLERQTNFQPTACWTCQTTCQTRCEHIACVTATQLICVDTDCQTSCKTGCQLFCMPTTMSVGCGHCETVACETTDCQTTSCQTTACQTLDCQTTDCQTTACQTLDCQTTDCQILDCQTLDCQTTGCQTAAQE